MVRSGAVLPRKKAIMNQLQLTSPTNNRVPHRELDLLV